MFELTIFEDDKPTVIVLNQLDSRYKATKQFYYAVSFYVYEKGNELQSANYVHRSNITEFDERSTNIEVVLAPGTYTIIPKLQRWWVEDDDDDDEKLLEEHWRKLKEEDARQFEEDGELGKLAAKTRLNVDDVGSTSSKDAKSEIKEINDDKWELMIGVRVYSMDKNFQVTAIQDDLASAKGSKKIADPEALENSTATEKKEADDKEKDVHKL
jgi:hypothetical protein